MFWTAIILGAALAGAPQHDHGEDPAQLAAGPAPSYEDNACVQCHRNLAGRSAEIVELEWARSVHYRNNVACDGCHGGDATLKGDQFPAGDAFKQATHMARNPEFMQFFGGEPAFVSRARGRGISYFCGRCHAEIMEKHLGSPHGNFGDPSCLYCHGRGSHAIGDADIEIIDTRPRSEAGRCSPCHQSSTMKVVEDIKTVLSDTALLIDSSAEKFSRLKAMGYRNLALGAQHEHTADTHSRLRRTFHSFNMRAINELARSIKAVADQTDYAFDLVQALERARERQARVGIAAVVFLLCFAGLLLYYKHRFCEDYSLPVVAADGERAPDAPLAEPSSGAPGPEPDVTGGDEKG